MKKLFLIIFFIFLYFSNVNSQYNWTWLSPKPQGNSLKNIRHISANKIYAVGELGSIIRSDDRGLNWKVLNSNTNVNLNNIFCFDSSKIFVPGNSGVLLKSTNDGYSWSSTIINSSVNLTGIDFYNNQYGFLTGNNNLYYTTNGGDNWNIKYSLSGGNNITDVGFIDSNNIIMTFSYTGYPPANYVIHSTNSGNNWSSPVAGGQDLEILPNHYCFVTTGGGLLKSTDMGISWTSIPVASSINKIGFVNSNTGYCLGYSGNGYIYKTINGGNNWSQINSHGYWFRGFSNYGDSLLIACGEYGMIKQSTNNGISWTELVKGNPLTASIKCIYFMNELTGWAGGAGYDIPTYYGGSLLKTTNAGLSWESILPANYQINDIKFVNNNTGFAADGYIYKTTNAGLNWVSTFATGDWIYKIDFVNENTGYIVSGNGGIYKTTNTGTGWNLQYQNPYSGLYSIHFVDDLTGIAVGRETGGLILKTTNGGINWNQQNSGYNYYLYIYDVFMINNNLIFAVGNDGIIFKTTNGGDNWNYTSFAGSLNKITFFDSQNGIILGSGATFLKTSNAGINWVQQYVPCLNNLYGAWFFNSTTGFITGDHGTILVTGISYTKVSTFENDIPKNYSLFQNYPNPFNSMTNVKFKMLNAGNAIIKVFDITGKEVEVLVNEYLQPGTYEVRFDVRHGGSSTELPSGIYFYRMETEKFTETKKLILLK